MYYLTKQTYEDYLNAKNENKDRLILSLDLGISKTLVSMQTLDKIFSEIKKIKEKELYVYDGKSVFKPQYFSDAHYSLALDENNYPCLYIDGVKMQVGKDIGVKNYYQKIVDLLKLDETDSVLEICTGLGYSTLIMSEIVRNIVTIEKSNEVIELAKINPYSKDLFKRKNITQKQGNAFDLIKQFKDKTFTKIFHDPPTFKFAPELYSDEFYLELNRVAKEHCRLFHYTGNPGSRFRNNNIVNTVSKKLVDAGWKIIRKSELGIYAIKD